jgi:hypothetical protein
MLACEYIRRQEEVAPGPQQAKHNYRIRLSHLQLLAAGNPASSGWLALTATTPAMTTFSFLPRRSSRASSRRWPVSPMFRRLPPARRAGEPHRRAVTLPAHGRNHLAGRLRRRNSWNLSRLDGSLLPSSTRAFACFLRWNRCVGGDVPTTLAISLVLPHNHILDSRWSIRVPQSSTWFHCLSASAPLPRWD